MTKQSPFFVNHGYHPYTRMELQRDQVPSATEWVNWLSKVRQEAEAALALAKAAMKQQFDKHHSESRDYKPRDLVWLEGTNIKTQRPAKKLNHLQHGPFVIMEKVRQVAYWLKLLQTPTWYRKHDVFNKKLLKPFIKPSFDIQPNDPPAPPDLVEEEEEYEVEAILDSHKKGWYIEYLVKWKGYMWWIKFNVRTSISLSHAEMPCRDAKCLTFSTSLWNTEIRIPNCFNRLKLSSTTAIAHSWWHFVINNTGWSRHRKQ